MTSTEREAAIDSARARMVEAAERHAWKEAQTHQAEMLSLIRARTDERIAEMERERGLT